MGGSGAGLGGLGRGGGGWWGGGGRVGGGGGGGGGRVRVREYVSGLVAGLERKNGWTLAERAGEACPDGMQRLLRRADWDVDGVRDDVRDHVIEHLGDPDGVLIGDETGF